MIQADAGFVARLRRIAAPAPDGAAAFLFDRAAAGAMASLDKVSFTGHVGPAEAAGTLSFSGLDCGAGVTRLSGGTDQDRPTLLNLSLKADVSLGLRDGRVPDTPTLAVKDGQFLAERIVLGQNVFAGVSGNLTVDKTLLVVTLGALSAAEGTIDGNAAFTTSGRLEALQLGFHDVAQQILFRRLYGDLFAAEGLVTGSLNLVRVQEAADLIGAIDLAASRPGRLKFSRPAAEILARQKPGASPSTIEQLTDYPYATGQATFMDQYTNPGKRALQITLDYPRQDGAEITPARGAYLLKETLTLDSSVAQILAEFLGWGRPPAAAPPVP